jgi:hypothetical protein
MRLRIRHLAPCPHLLPGGRAARIGFATTETEARLTEADPGAFGRFADYEREAVHEGLLWRRINPTPGGREWFARAVGEPAPLAGTESLHRTPLVPRGAGGAHLVSDVDPSAVAILDAGWREEASARLQRHLDAEIRIAGEDVWQRHAGPIHWFDVRTGRFDYAEEPGALPLTPAQSAGSGVGALEEAIAGEADGIAAADGFRHGRPIRPFALSDSVPAETLGGLDLARAVGALPGATIALASHRLAKPALRDDPRIPALLAVLGRHEFMARTGPPDPDLHETILSMAAEVLRAVSACAPGAVTARASGPSPVAVARLHLAAVDRFLLPRVRAMATRMEGDDAEALAGLAP